MAEVAQEISFKKSEPGRKWVERFEIRLDGAARVFREGDLLRGSVRLVTTSEVKVKAVRIELCGEAVVRSDGQRDGVFRDKSILREENREIYFYKQLTLLQKGGEFLAKDPVLAAGNYVYSFDCRLPPELPCSFEGRHGQIRYVVKALIERAWKSAVTTRTAFSVVNGHDLNFIPETSEAICVSRQREVGGLCCNSGSVTVEWRVPRSGFVPGEDIPVGGVVQNESRETVASSRAALFMVVNYKGKRCRLEEERQVTALEKGPTAPGRLTVWDETLHIPPVPPTGIGRCSIIDVTYELRFTVCMKSKADSISSVQSIFIGTVPLSNTSGGVDVPGHLKIPDVPDVPDVPGKRPPPYAPPNLAKLPLRTVEFMRASAPSPAASSGPARSAASGSTDCNPANPINPAKPTPAAGHFPQDVA